MTYKKKNKTHDALQLTWPPNALVKGMMFISTGTGLRSTALILIFILLGRILGPNNYGAYSALLAIAMALGSLTGLGSNYILIRDVARKADQFHAIWSRTLSAIVISGPIILLAYTAIAYVILGDSISLLVITLLGTSEIIFAPLGYAAIAAFQGREKNKQVAFLTLLPMLPRLFAILLLLALKSIYEIESLLTYWSALHAAAAIVASIIAIRMVQKLLVGKNKTTLKGGTKSIREGMMYSFSAVSLKIYSDIVKTMLARMSTFDITGLYSAAYRITDLVLVPVNGLLTAATTELIRNGEQGLKSALSSGLSLLLIPTIYALVSALALYYVAYALPLVLGQAYAPAIPMLQVLSLLPLISLPRLFLQRIFISADRQALLARTILLGSLANIGLNLYLIPAYSWHGAIYATYLSEFLTIVIMAGHITWQKRDII